VTLFHTTPNLSNVQINKRNDWTPFVKGIVFIPKSLFVSKKRLIIPNAYFLSVWAQRPYSFYYNQFFWAVISFIPSVGVSQIIHLVRLPERSKRSVFHSGLISFMYNTIKSYLFPMFLFPNLFEELTRVLKWNLPFHPCRSYPPE